jgi:cytoskeleton protein RodZ
MLLGARLQAAREARGLSIRDVAQRLRLDAHIIEALEADNLERLPARTFVRGYLRNYTRLVGLDEGLVAEAFPEAEATPAAALKRRHGHRAPMAVPALGRWLGYLLLLVVLAGVLFLAYPAGKRLWEGWQASGPAADAGLDLRLPTPAAPVQDGPGEDLEPIWPLPAMNEAETGAEALPEPEPIVAPEVSAEPAPARTAALRNVAAAPGVQLVLYFREQSWTEVHDRERRLLYGLMNPGRREALSGTPPFRVLLGNAAGVDVEYAGRPFDLAAHTQGAVARFRLE